MELGFIYFLNNRNGNPLKTGNVFLMTPILSIWIFSWFVNHPNFGKGTWIRTLGKKYSLHIYLWHTLVIWFIEDIDPNRYFLIILPITILLSIIISYIINFCVSHISFDNFSRLKKS